MELYRHHNSIGMFESHKILFLVQPTIYWWSLDKSLFAQQTYMSEAMLDSGKQIPTKFAFSVQGIYDQAWVKNILLLLIP